MGKITEIRYVGYAVVDFAAERQFYLDQWKLREVAGDATTSYLAAEGSPEKFVVRLRAAEQKRVDVIAWAAASRTDVDQLHAAVVGSGAKVIHPPRPLTGLGGGYGFRFFDPNGIAVEISSDVERGPSRTVARWEGMPATISHVVVHSPDHHGLVKFYEQVLGFRTSDWLGDFMCFLRCNEWHHRLAILPGPPCLDHVAYDVPTVDDMFRGIARLKEAGTPVAWGPGRHTAGDNTFSYFVTPAGFVVEYTSELVRIPDEAAWQPTVYKPSHAIMDQWGIGYGGPQTMPRSAPDAGVFAPPPI
jgi:predicted enzyme related to lactoylglutathione lyase